MFNDKKRKSRQNCVIYQWHKLKKNNHATYFINWDTTPLTERTFYRGSLPRCDGEAPSSSCCCCSSGTPSVRQRTLPCQRRTNINFGFLRCTQQCSTWQNHKPPGYSCRPSLPLHRPGLWRWRDLTEAPRVDKPSALVTAASHPAWWWNTKPF